MPGVILVRQPTKQIGPGWALFAWFKNIRPSGPFCCIEWVRARMRTSGSTTERSEVERRRFGPAARRARSLRASCPLATLVHPCSSRVARVILVRHAKPCSESARTRLYGFNNGALFAWFRNDGPALVAGFLLVAGRWVRNWSVRQNRRKVISAYPCVSCRFTSLQRNRVQGVARCTHPGWDVAGDCSIQSVL